MLLMSNKNPKSTIFTLIALYKYFLICLPYHIVMAMHLSKYKYNWSFLRKTPKNPKSRPKSSKFENHDFHKEFHNKFNKVIGTKIQCPKIHHFSTLWIMHKIPKQNYWNHYSTNIFISKVYLHDIVKSISNSIWKQSFQVSI